MGENNGTIINLIRLRAIPVNISGRNGNQTFWGGVSQSTEHFEPWLGGQLCVAFHLSRIIFTVTAHFKKLTWSLMSVMLSWQVPLRAGQLVVPAVRCSWLPRAASSASVLLSDNLVFHETYMQHKYPNDYIITFINVMKCPNSWIAIWSIYSNCNHLQSNDPSCHQNTILIYLVYLNLMIT